MPETPPYPVAAPAHEDTVREFSEALASLLPGQHSRRTSRELLSLVWGCTPGWVAAHADDVVPDGVRQEALAAAMRHAAGEPLAYAARRAAFRDLVLEVDERVLIPRPETEIVVEFALGVCRTGLAADVGTGSGAIALALATEGGYTRVIATDVSTDALEVARLNLELIDTDCPVELRSGSLLGPLRGEQFDLLVCNPPYIAAGEIAALPPSVHDWEPPLALVSGDDGMAHTRELIESAAALIKPGGWLVLEIDSRRAGPVEQMLNAQAAFTDVVIRPDLTGRPRVAAARRSNPNLERN